MISGSPRADFPSIAGRLIRSPTSPHPFGHHRCILRSPTGSVCPPPTPPNPAYLTLRPVVCKEFFQALEACHADNWRKWTGGCNNDKNELNMCLRKVVRSHFACRLVPVPLTGVGVATGGFGTKPGACEGTTKEDRECMEGTTPRRLGQPTYPYRECHPNDRLRDSTRIYHVSRTLALYNNLTIHRHSMELLGSSCIRSLWDPSRLPHEKRNHWLVLGFYYTSI